MKKNIRQTLALVVTLSLAGLSSNAAELGMKAPELSIAQFVKGQPVNLAKGAGKNIYVVEFWATWCGPCRVSIPHLTELQAKFKDKGVTIIGISDETVDKVKPFVDDMGDKMDYVVAVDKNRATFGKYMTAFNQGGIPTAFVVDKAGKIVWYGHPMGDLENVLEEVVAGKFNVAAYKARTEKNEKLQTAMGSYLDETVKGPVSASATATGNGFVKDCDDPAMLNQFAWIILTHPKVKHRDLELASTAAKKAYDLTKGNNPAVTDTYARALYDSGKKAEAIKYQQDAVNKESDPKRKASLEKTLADYKAGKKL